jgi:hypothetical protein
LAFDAWVILHHLDHPGAAAWCERYDRLVRSGGRIT